MSGLVVKMALVLGMGVGGWQDGIAAHYSPGLFERVAARRGLPSAECYISSDWHPLGTFVLVYGGNTRASLVCQVTDVSQPRDRRRHARDRLFEIDFHSAAVLCGSTELRNRDCPVQVSKQSVVMRKTMTVWYNKSTIVRPAHAANMPGHRLNLTRRFSMSTVSQTPSIYQIRHVDSGRVYVGSAVNPRRRWNGHRSQLSRGMHSSPHLQSAWNKYGESAFVFEIIEPVLFVEDLVAREQYWIDKLHSYDPRRGFNVSPTAGSPLGVKHSEAVRMRVSERLRKRFADPVERAKQSERVRAHYANPDERAKQSRRVAARFADPVERAKQSERAKARFTDPAERAKQSAHLAERYSNPVEREKIAEQLRERWKDPEYRARQSEKNAQWDAEKRARQSERIRKHLADPAARAKWAECQRARFVDPAEQAKRVEHNRNLNNDPSIRKKRSEKMRAAWADPVWRAQRLAAVARGQKRKKRKTED